MLSKQGKQLVQQAPITSNDGRLNGKEEERGERERERERERAPRITGKGDGWRSNKISRKKESKRKFREIGRKKKEGKKKNLKVWLKNLCGNKMYLI